MGTKSTLSFYDDKQCVCRVYHQYDGYPSWMGKQIFTFLDAVKFVNGSEMGVDYLQYNGVGNLAAHWIHNFIKNERYISLFSTEDDGKHLWRQDFNYEIYLNTFKVDDLLLKCYCQNDLLFEGNLEKFKLFCNR